MSRVPGIAAALVQRFDQKALGAAIGVTIVILNLDRVISLVGIDPSIGILARVTALLAGALTVGVLLLRGRMDEAEGVTVAAPS